MHAHSTLKTCFVQPHNRIVPRDPPSLARRRAPSRKDVRQNVVLNSIALRAKLGLLVLAMLDSAKAVHPTPAGLTELSSTEGLQMLRNSTPNDQFWLLAQEFTTQDSQDWCGLASASMVLNALPIPKPALKAFDGWVSHLTLCSCHICTTARDHLPCSRIAPLH